MRKFKIVMKCAGCNKTLEDGDRYIVDTPSGFLKTEPDPETDDLITTILGGSDGKVYYCEDCTEPGGDYVFYTFYDEDD